MMKYVCALLSVFSINASAEDREYRDLYYLAEALYHEARGEPDEYVLLVAETVEQRVLQPRFKSANYEEAVHKKAYSKRAGKVVCSYEYYCDGKSDVMSNPVQKARMLSLAGYFLYGGYERRTRGADHYYAHDTLVPYWAPYMYDVITLGGHTFGKLDW